MKAKRGWIPASYLEPLDGPDEAEDPEPNYAGALSSAVYGVGERGSTGPGILRTWKGLLGWAMIMGWAEGESGLSPCSLTGRTWW